VSESIPNRWLTIPEAASILRISERTLYENVRRFGSLDRDGHLPIIRVGRSIRIPAGALDGQTQHSDETALGTRDNRNPETERSNAHAHATLRVVAAGGTRR
jgi:excisionase family DNA binding protein